MEDHSGGIEKSSPNFNQNTFSAMIEKRAYASGEPLISEIAAYCSESGLHHDDVKPLINQHLKERLEVELWECKLLKKRPDHISTNKLPI